MAFFKGGDAFDFTAYAQNEGETSCDAVQDGAEVVVSDSLQVKGVASLGALTHVFVVVHGGAEQGSGGNEKGHVEDEPSNTCGAKAKAGRAVLRRNWARVGCLVRLGTRRIHAPKLNAERVVVTAESGISVRL